MRVIGAAALAGLAAAMALAGSVSARPDRTGVQAGIELADFGDAPDGIAVGGLAGRFPSLASSGGAQAGDSTYVLLGRGVDEEADSDQVDRDRFDDGVAISRLVSCGPSALVVVVTAPARGEQPRGTAFLNVFFDWDRDGRWAGTDGSCGRRVSEWGVRNARIDLSKQGFSRVYRIPFPAGRGLDGFWYRAILSLDEPWRNANGAGAFASGEVEDHLVRPKKPPDNKGKTTGADCLAFFPIVHGRQGVLSIRRKPGATAPILSARLSADTQGVNADGSKAVSPQRVITRLPGLGRFAYRSTQRHAILKSPPAVAERIRFEVRFSGVGNVAPFFVRVVSCDITVIHDLARFVPVIPGGAPIGPPPSPVLPGSPPSSKPTSKRSPPQSLAGCLSNVNIVINHTTTFFIPADAVTPTHAILVPGASSAVARPICPATTETESAEFFPPGVTPPGGSPPPPGERAYRVTISATGGAVARGPASPFEVQVRWANP